MQMRISRLLQSFVALAFTAGSVAMIGGTASAAGARGAISVANPASTVGGYSVAVAAFTADSGEQSDGSVACPSGSVPWGGGAEINSHTLEASLNSSFAYSGASGTGWSARVNNTSGSSVTFKVYAVCADEPAKYEIVDGATQEDPAGSQAANFAACPKGTVSFGGGGVSSSSDTSVNIMGIQPIIGDGIYNFEFYVNNRSASETSLNAQVICGKKPTGYVTKTARASNPSGKDSSAHAACPSDSLALGGGVLPSISNIGINVNTTEPHSDDAWFSYQNNGSGSNASVTSYAVCAK